MIRGPRRLFFSSLQQAGGEALAPAGAPCAAAGLQLLPHPTRHARVAQHTPLPRTYDGRSIHHAHTHAPQEAVCVGLAFGWEQPPHPTRHARVAQHTPLPRTSTKQLRGLADSHAGWSARHSIHHTAVLCKKKRHARTHARTPPQSGVRGACPWAGAASAASPGAHPCWWP